MGLISLQAWDKYINSQKLAHTTFHTHSIIWLKQRGNLRDRWGEDLPRNEEEITLPCLKNYNVLRTWPITQNTEVGETDKQSIQLWFSKPKLVELGYVTEGRFDYRPDFDRFKIGDIIYKAQGDTPASQAYEDDLVFTIIIRPEEKNTGDV